MTILPPNPLPTLTEEIIGALPALMITHPLGPRLTDIVSLLSADWMTVRQAAFELDTDGRAKVARRGRALHLLPIDDPTPVCVICHAVFKPARRTTRTCSYSCARHLAWQNPDMRARHSTSLRAARSTPEGRIKQAEASRQYFSDPSAREAMGDINRRVWADPEKSAKRLISINLAWEDPERRAKQAVRRTKDWKDPAFRAKAVAGMRNSKRASARRHIVELASTYPRMTPCEIGELVGRTAETVEFILRRARKLGEIGPRPGDGPRLRRMAEACA